MNLEVVHLGVLVQIIMEPFIMGITLEESLIHPEGDTRSTMTIYSIKNGGQNFSTGTAWTRLSMDQDKEVE